MAKMFLDPFAMTPRRALETIAGELQRQYERWQSKARYRSSLDPTQDDIKKICMTLRRNARVCCSVTLLFVHANLSSRRKNVFYFITMVMASLVQLPMVKFGYLTKILRNIFPYHSMIYKNG